MLITLEELQERLARRDCVVFDCRHDLVEPQRGRAAYHAGHLPGAHFASVDNDLSGERTGRNGRHPLPEAIEFAAFLNRHGVTPATPIVAYDDAGGSYAARLWWLARWIGLTHVAVLDGGWKKWLAEGRPVTTEAPAQPNHGCVVAQPAGRMVQTAADVLAATRERTCLVVDARAPERFRGEVEPIDRVGGHIPTAVNRCYRDNLNPDQTLRPAEDLRREFKALLGNWKPADVVHQCGSGITACVNLLAMEVAGLVGSRLYPGSWSEWSSDPSRPIARGA
ncbi:MAG TPA: sulfurtransferase [Opitutaceae bacterium]|nr:sulfurtransferase [Opitutaceae bacterium]